MRDYRGKSGERANWKFDASLVSQINDVLKQVAIEEGSGAKSEMSTTKPITYLNAGQVIAARTFQYGDDA